MLRDIGIQGILFDNEEYAGEIWHYPANMRYPGTNSLSDYYAQARLRGGQIITAIQSVYPEVEFMVLLSPSENCPGTPDLVRAWSPDPNNVAGAFTVGLMERSNKAIIDGKAVSYATAAKPSLMPRISGGKRGWWAARRVRSFLRPCMPLGRIGSASPKPCTTWDPVCQQQLPVNDCRDDEPSPGDGPAWRGHLCVVVREEGQNWYNPVGSTYGIPTDWYNAVHQAWLATRSPTETPAPPGVPGAPRNLRVVPPN